MKGESKSTSASSPRRRPFASSWLLVAATALIGAILWPIPLGITQDNPSKESPAADIVETLRKWWETEYAISAEKSAWTGDKAEFGQLIELYTREIEELQKLVDATGDAATGSESKRRELIEEEAGLQQASARLGAVLSQLEASLLRLAPAFPKPLRQEIIAPATRLAAKTGRERPHQERIRDLLGVLVAADKFQQQVTVDREIRTLEDGKRVELQVIYLGLARAFYVDESSRHAGVGTPTLAGWKWVPNPDIATRIRQAASILDEREQEARFLRLPLQIGNITAARP